MAFEDWEKRLDGNIKVCPLAGYDSFRPFGMMCGIRLHYVENESQLLSGEPLFLPLIMHASQARDLAAALTRLADTVETPPSAETAQ